MGAVTNYPFHDSCLTQCGAATLNFYSVDIDHPSEPLELELHRAVTKLDGLRVSVSKEQIKFKELVKKYHTTLCNMTVTGSSQYSASIMARELSIIKKGCLKFSGLKIKIVDEFASTSFNYVQRKIYRDKLNSIDKSLEFFENVTVFKERIEKEFDVAEGSTSLISRVTYFLPFVTLLASYLPIKV